MPAWLENILIAGLVTAAVVVAILVLVLYVVLVALVATSPVWMVCLLLWALFGK